MSMGKQRAATIKKVAEMMRNLDYCMMTTRASDGGLHARPMSNNGEVEFDGDVGFSARRIRGRSRRSRPNRGSS